MNFFLKSLFISLGMIIATLLAKYTTITSQYLLIAAGILFILSVIASLANNNKPKVSRKNSSSQSNNSSMLDGTVLDGTVNGTVKWFNKTKGFGFITQEDGEDIFVHQTGLAFKSATLRDGQNVTMQVVMDEKGPQAENVRRA